MDRVMTLSRRNRILIALAVIVVIIGIVIFALLPNKDSRGDTSVTTTHVPQGDTVTPNSNGPLNGQGGSNQNGQPGSGDNTSQGDTSTTPTNEQFSELILKTDGIAPGPDGQVHFGITGIKNPIPGWYIVTISVAGTGPSKVIFQQTGVAGYPLTVVAGPGTSFPPEVIHIPDAVRSAL